MADQRNRLMDGNDFGPLTPEQKAAVERDAVHESLGPMDFLPGGWTALGAGVGAAALPFVAKDWPWLLRHYGKGDGAKYIAQDIGKLVGGGGLLGYARDVMDVLSDNYSDGGQYIDGRYVPNPTPKDRRKSERALSYPPGFPRLERSEDEMKARYAEFLAEGAPKTNRYGVFGGGTYPYEDWLALNEQYGGTLRFPPSMNRTFNRDSPLDPERKGYGPGPYPVARNRLMEPE